MKSESRRIIHMGIGYLMIPSLTISKSTLLSFQQQLLSEGMDYHSSQQNEQQIVIVRQSPAILETRVDRISDQLGQLVIVSPEPKTALNTFMGEVEATLAAFNKVWVSPARQIRRVEATFRELYEATEVHAFQELWETRLGQPQNALAVFGRPIRGGGLRLVMDPVPNETLPANVEVKIESWLTDSSKIFVEIQFVWQDPSDSRVFNPNSYLMQLNSFATNQLAMFLSGEGKSHETKQRKNAK